MRQVDPPLVIEDLVRFGEDRGYERGLNEGLKRGLDEGLERGVDEGGRAELRRSIVDLLAARGIAIEPDQRARIDAEHDLERLRAALRRAAMATTASGLLQ